jgi:hypothetical protein
MLQSKVSEFGLCGLWVVGCGLCDEFLVHSSLVTMSGTGRGPRFGVSHGFLSRKSTVQYRVQVQVQHCCTWYIHTVPGTDSNRFIKILLGDDLAGLFFGSFVRQYRYVRTVQ